MLLNLMATLALNLATPTLAPPPPSNHLTQPAPTREPAKQPTMAGANLRANRRMEAVQRQDLFDSVPVGARGRINSTRDAATAGENFPGFRDRTLQSF